MCYKFKPLLQIFKLFYRGWGGYRVYNNVFIYFLNHTETSLRTGTALKEEKAAALEREVTRLRETLSSKSEVRKFNYVSIMA